VFSRSTGSSPLDASASRGISHRSAYRVPKESTYPREFHPSSYGPRSGFLILFAAYSSLGRASLFHPANALRLLPPGISPPKEPHLLFASDVPSCRCSGGCAPACLGSRDPRRTSHPSLGDGAGALGRLHGFTPLESPFRRSMVLARTAVEPLLGFSLSKAFPARCDWNGSSPSFLPCAFPASALPGCPVSPFAAALRSLARPEGGFASLEAAVPS
jgi:hypothetical protein